MRIRCAKKKQLNLSIILYNKISSTSKLNEKSIEIFHKTYSRDTKLNSVEINKVAYYKIVYFIRCRKLLALKYINLRKMSIKFISYDTIFRIDVNFRRLKFCILDPCVF